MTGTILIPTDLTEDAAGATRYGLNLAQRLGAEAAMVHIYQLPVPPSDIPVVYFDTEEAYRGHLAALTAHTEIWKREFPSLKIKCQAIPGTVQGGIKDAVEEFRADLVVMTLTEHSDLGSMLLGHNAIDVINHSRCPVLVVPRGCLYTDPEKIMLAFDRLEVKNPDLFTVITDLAQLQNAEVLAMHVIENRAGAGPGPAAVASDLSRLLTGIRHTWYYPESDAVLYQLERFMVKHRPDLVVMIHHARGFLRRMFSTQHTKEMAMRTNKPLLVLPG